MEELQKEFNEKKSRLASEYDTSNNPYGDILQDYYQIIKMEKILYQNVVKWSVELTDDLLNELRKEKNPDAKSGNKEIAIGEFVEYQGKHCVCMEQDSLGCDRCVFLSKDDDCKFSGSFCNKEYRKDGKNVVFIKQE